MTVPAPPPGPLGCLVEAVPAGTVLFRVHSPERPGTVFNPGYGRRTRFAFFGDPPVPVLYAGQTPQSAVFESVFHDTVPGAVVPAHEWRDRVLSAIRVERDLRLAQFHSDGLRRLHVYPRDLTDTPPTTYPDTVAWAQAVHDHPDRLDGIVWMSRQFNTDRAYVLFGDRVAADEIAVVEDHAEARAFAVAADEEWLAALANRIDVTLSLSAST